jgi:hypothetical protein
VNHTTQVAGREKRRSHTRDELAGMKVRRQSLEPS